MREIFTLVPLIYGGAHATNLSLGLGDLRIDVPACFLLSIRLLSRFGLDFCGLLGLNETSIAISDAAPSALMPTARSLNVRLAYFAALFLALAARKHVPATEVLEIELILRLSVW